MGSDGGIFSYNAPFLGSTGSIHLNRPIVGMEATPNGQGYRFVASDGGVFTYGNAPFEGSTGGLALAAPVVGLAADNATNGYWMAAADGGIFTFGGASFLGRVVSSSSGREQPPAASPREFIKRRRLCQHPSQRHCGRPAASLQAQAAREREADSPRDVGGRARRPRTTFSQKVPFISSFSLPHTGKGKRGRKDGHRGTTVHRHARRIATLLLPIGVMLSTSVATGLSSAPAGAAGILPPANPPANIAPSSSDWLASIDSAAAAEGVGPMPVVESELAALPKWEQMFAVLNYERIDRDLPPIEYMTTQLNFDALAASAAGTDPSFPSALTGGAPLTYGGALWAGGMSSVLQADYYWMYDDGWGGAATSNMACSSAGAASCWDHRDIVLHEFGDCPSGPPVLSMGADFSPTGFPGGSFAAVMVSSCSAPADVTVTWSQVAAELSPTRVIGIAPMSNGTGYWEAEANGTVGAFGSAQNYGSVTSGLNAPIVGIAATPGGGGYWLVASDGGIFNFGDAAFYGSTGSLHLNKPIVGMASTPDGKGYWLVASDGGIFSYGDAAFYGSMGGAPLNAADRRHRRRPGHGRLLGGGVGRRHLQLQGPVLGQHGQHPSQPAHRGHGGHAERPGLPLRGLRRRRLHLRERTVRGLDGWPGARCSRRRPGRRQRHQRILDGRSRRGRVHLRRRPVPGAARQLVVDRAARRGLRRRRPRSGAPARPR